MVLDALRINGLSPESSDAEILRVFKALKYSPVEMQEVLELIRTKFPEPIPYVKEDSPKDVPHKRIKIEKINTIVEKEEAPVPPMQRILIPAIPKEAEQPKVPVPAPIRIASVSEKPSMPVPEKIQIQSPVQILAENIKKDSKMPPAPEPNLEHVRDRSLFRYVFIGIFIVVLITIALFFMYIDKKGPFAEKTYPPESAVISSLLSNATVFHPSTYALFISVTALPTKASVGTSSAASSTDTSIPQSLQSAMIALQMYEKTILPDTNFILSASTSIQYATSTSTNWSLDIDSRGTANYLGYNVSINTVKKSSDYYFRINRAPFIFANEFSSLKNKWVAIKTLSTSTATASKSIKDNVASLLQSIPMYSNEFAVTESKTALFLQEAIKFINKDKPLQYKGKPYTEKINGSNYTHYDFSWNKNTLGAFYQDLKSGSQNDLEPQQFKDFTDNGHLTIWTDEKGIPASAQYIYNDGKSSVTIRISFSNINKPLQIHAPVPSTDIEASSTRDAMNLFIKKIILNF